MTADKDYLYIFLHIPKTAGSTFSFHIQKNLKENERLLLTYDLLCINSRRPPMDAQVYRNKAWEYMSKISREEKRNIKVIYGHIVPYGIHKLFDRPARYITIFRDPVKRVKSIYKYKVGLYLKDSQLERKTGDYETTLLIKNQVPLFKDWLSNKYNPKRGLGIFSMTQTLKLYGYLTTTSVCGIKDALNKFYFIGISQNYNSESLFIYDKLGFNKYFIDQNISSSVAKIGMTDTQIYDLISKKDKDTLLFNLAKHKNKLIKQELVGYQRTVNTKRQQRKLLLPFTQILFAPRHTIIRLEKYIRGEIPLSSAQ